MKKFLIKKDGVISVVSCKVKPKGIKSIEIEEGKYSDLELNCLDIDKDGFAHVSSDRKKEYLKIASPKRTATQKKNDEIRFKLNKLMENEKVLAYLQSIAES